MITDTTRRWRARLAALGVLTTLAAITGCSDSGAPRPGGGDDEDVVVLVSDPVSVAVSASAMSAIPALPAAYVSMAPGTMAAAATGTIRNRRTTETVTVDFVGGGFDPVAMVAEGSDSLDFVIDTGGTVPVRFARTVPRDAPVRTVRTEPPAGKRDVPLNLRARVVFSKPVDPATVTTATVGLEQAGASVSGTVGLSADGLVASFQPATTLLPATAYMFTVGTGIRDGDGNPLASPVTVPFTTGSAAVPAVRQVAFVRRAQPGPGGSLGPSSIYVANADGSGATVLTSGDDPALSWDGRRVAFVRESSIWIIDADGTDERRLIGNARAPAWSPDGSRIALVMNEGLMVMGLLDASPTLVLAVDFAGSGMGLGWPAWSPEGQRISFVRHGDWVSEANQLYIVNTDGSEPHPVLIGQPCEGCVDVVHQPGSKHSWSPDGSRLATAIGKHANTGGDSHLVLSTFAPTGADLDIHHEDPAAWYMGNPDWTPDGRQVVFEKYVVASGCVPPACPMRLFITNLDDALVHQFIPELPGAAPYWDDQVTLARRPE